MGAMSKSNPYISNFGKVRLWPTNDLLNISSESIIQIKLNNTIEIRIDFFLTNFVVDGFVI